MAKLEKVEGFKKSKDFSKWQRIYQKVLKQSKGLRLRFDKVQDEGRRLKQALGQTEQMRGLLLEQSPDEQLNTLEGQPPGGPGEPNDPRRGDLYEGYAGAFPNSKLKF